MIATYTYTSCLLGLSFSSSVWKTISEMDREELDEEFIDLK